MTEPEWVRSVCADIGKIGCLYPTCDCGFAKLIIAARAAGRREAIEECAKVADGGVRLIEHGGPIKFVSPEKFAGDMARDIADGIRALADQPAPAAPPEPSETEVEAAEDAIAKNRRIGIVNPKNLAKAALTAAAKVRAR